MPRAQKRRSHQRQNDDAFLQYMERLTEISISSLAWGNLPGGVDPRFLELTLFTDGSAVFFFDDALDDYLALQVTNQGPLDVYREPIRYRAFAANGYQRQLDQSNSVIIHNNYMHTNSVLAITQYARRLAELDRILDVNANAQKTPVMITGNQQQMFTLQKLYEQYDGNAPVLFGDKNLDLNAIKAISTQAPYICDKIYQLKTDLWNEALTYLGVPNISVQKKERMITDEVIRGQGGTLASRYSRLQARKDAAEKINKMFDLDITVDFRTDFDQNMTKEKTEELESTDEEVGDDE